jgi:hypothetical protein
MSSQKSGGSEGIPALVLADSESVGKAALSGGDVEEQAFFGLIRPKATKQVDIDPTKLSESLADITAKLEKVLENQKKKEESNGFYLESFSVGLAIEGRGKVFMVAEVGVEASIEVTFKRRV